MLRRYVQSMMDVEKLWHVHDGCCMVTEFKKKKKKSLDLEESERQPF